MKPAFASKRLPTIKKAAVAIAATALLGASCGGGATNGEDVITAADLDAAAQSVIDEQPANIAEALTIAEVKTDAIAACGAMADVPNSQPGSVTASDVGRPEYAAAIEAGANDIENLDFLTRELPYISMLGKYFCPAEAVRTNVL